MIDAVSIRRTGRPVARAAVLGPHIEAARRWAMLALLLPVLLVAFAAGPALAQRGAPESFANLAERVLPAVVNISTTQTVQNRGNRPMPQMPDLPPGSPFEEFFREFFERQQRGGEPGAPPRRATSLGSGFVIDASGFIVTNNHVIDGADEIRVLFQDEQNTELKAELIGTDPATDLALLKVEPKGFKLTALTWGDSDKLRVGDWVVAIGNPFGLGGTVTAGIVSARSRDIGAGNYDDFIQTDASINRGNSGGPLVNLAGEVVGINTAIYSQTGGSVGIGFAIPATMARNVIAQLRDNGQVRRGWLGVQIQPVTKDIAESMGLKEDRGALVSVVTPDGPAEKAGIKPGDVIVGFNNREVSTSRSLPRMVAETAVGQKVPVTVIRRNDRQTIQVTLGELKPQDLQLASVPGREEPTPGDAQAIEEVGVSVSTLSPEVRREFALAEQSKGVVITKVEPNSPAAGRQLRPGDIIVEVSQEPVSSPADVAERVKKAKDAGQRALLLLIERQGELLFQAVPIGER